MPSYKIDPAIWQEPPRGGFAEPEIVQLPGIDRMRAMNAGAIPLPPVSRLTGLNLVEVGVGSATYNLPLTPWFLPATGSVLGGILAFTADAALGSAIISALPPGFALTTSEISMNFLRPSSVNSTLIASARTIHVARSVGLAEVFVSDEQGRLLGHGSSRCVLIPMAGGIPKLPSYPEPPGETPDPHLREVVGEVAPQSFWARTRGRDSFPKFWSGEQAWPPLAHLTGLHPTEVNEGTATCVLPASPWLANYMGVVYGGAIALLADFGINCAIWTTLEAGQALGTLDLKLYFLKPVFTDGKNLIARASVVQRGRTLAVAMTRIENSEGKAVALAAGSAMVLTGRPASLSGPAPHADEEIQ
jgi:uncharacterized protein (TIGR00369 family)